MSTLNAPALMITVDIFQKIELLPNVNSHGLWCCCLSAVEHDSSNN